MRNRRNIAARTLRFAAAPVVLLGVLATLTPLLETDAWWARYTDFLRLQAAIALGAGMVVYLGAGGGRSRAAKALLLAGFVALCLQAYRLYPYSGLVAPMAVAAADCAEGDSVRILSANVQKSNEARDPLMAAVARTDPDVILLLETDAWWDEAITPLTDDYRDVVQDIPESAEAYGMHLLSRFPLENPRVELWFGAETPTILADIALPSGEEIAFIGLHPRPPLYWSQSSVSRDAHLLKAAVTASEAGSPTILAGDFNATPWERTSQRALRIGGLIDPRVGRGLVPTYDANNRLMSWPLDQVLFQDGMSVVDFARLDEIGSDHYPVLATLCRAPDLADRQSAPALAEGDMAEAERTFARAQSGQ